MKKIILLLVIFFQLFNSLYVSAQTNLRDVVYLKNGSIIKGTIVEIIPNQTIKIRTSDGSVFVYKMDEVDKITKEENTSLDKKSFSSDDSRQGLYVGLNIEPGCTYMLTEVAGKPHVSFSGGLSLGYYFSDHVGITTGFNIARYGITFNDFPIASNSYYSYYTGYYTNYIYGQSKVSMTYLNIPIAVSFITSDPGNVGFYADLGFQIGTMLSEKEVQSSAVYNNTMDGKDQYKSLQIFSNEMFGVHVPILNERLTLDAGPFINIGLLNQFTSDYTANARNGAVGLAFHLKYNLTK